MKTVDTLPPIALRDVIAHGVGGPAQLDDHLTSAVLQSRTTKAMLPSTRRSIDGQLRQAVEATFSRDVVAMLNAGWQATREFGEAASRTAAAPGVTEFVELLSLTIAQSIRPSVRLYVDRRLVMTVELEIMVKAGFNELAAVVRSGALVAIDFGQCTVTVVVCTSSGRQLVERSLTLTSNQRFGLPHPVTLVTPAAR
jgi:hypothetical protein